MRLVVLPLDFWMHHEMYYEDCDVVECDPIYGKDRIYMIGDKWWFEKNGRGFTYDTPKGIKDAIKQTKYEISVSIESILPDKEVKALKALAHFNKDPILRNRVLDLLSRHDQAVAIRETSRQTRKFLLNR